MESDARAATLIVIWVAFAIAAAATFWGRTQIEAESVFIALLYMIAATQATKYVTRVPGVDEEAVAAKAKNGKVSRLLSSLNDEELDILRKRLAADAPDEPADGEVVSLEDVLRKERTR